MVYLIHPLIQYILTGYIRERLQTNHIILVSTFSYTYASGTEIIDTVSFNDVQINIAF